MTPEQFAELFKQAVQEGHLKIEFERDSYLGDTSLELKISDKQGEVIFERAIYV